MLKALEVYQYDKKTRKGDNNDGGWVIAELDGSYDAYFSCGISNNESFSRSFISAYDMKKENNFAFDRTIEEYPYEYATEINLIKKNICNLETDTTTNLRDLTNTYEHIFLKMDIEGGEYPWLLAADKTMLLKFKQIVIEFHGINDDSWGCPLSYKQICLEKLAKTHYLVHVHGNNNGKVQQGIPDVIELTYVVKSYFTSPPELNTTTFPIPGIDYPNNPAAADYPIFKYPFVSVNKTIYMTYKKAIPDIVRNRWMALNEDYTINFSLDADCVSFLETHFNSYVVELFTKIPVGMYKADLWRLCCLYINGGVYADVDLVPYLSIDKLDKKITFYSTLSVEVNSIFQAFMVVPIKKNPLILQFIVSFLTTNPFTIQNGPCHDMYRCISYNLNSHLLSDTPYNISEIKIPIAIGESQTNTKIIDLYYFPSDIEYTIKIKPNPYNDDFICKIENNKLIITRLDEESGWGHPHALDICIKSSERILLFKEDKPSKTNIDCYVSYNNNKILDSRDPTYFHNKGW
jgi:hypothetical protein